MPTERDQTTSSRGALEHAALVERLQAEMYCEDLTPPDSSCNWPESLLRSWFADGGVLTFSAAAAEGPFVASRLADEIGAGLQLRALPVLSRPGGAIDAARRGDHAFFRELAARIGRVGAAATELLGCGGVDPVWAEVEEEGAALEAHMRPGMLRANNGEVVYGRSPSGAVRGDRFLFVLEAEQSGVRCPALSSLNEQLTAVGYALAAAVAEEAALQRMQILRRSDGLFACFPGDGSGYGAHVDGSDGTRLSMILYANRRWPRDAGGELADARAAMRPSTSSSSSSSITRRASFPNMAGELQMLEPPPKLGERRGGGGGDCEVEEDQLSGGKCGGGGPCWHTLAPEADRLVIFRSKDVLHRVAACSARRLALTCFWDVGHEYEDNYSGISE